jgi:hypothetical protein
MSVRLTQDDPGSLGRQRTKYFSPHRHDTDAIPTFHSAL